MTKVALKTNPNHRPFEAPRGYGWGFNPAKGTLTFFSPNGLRTYRADPPACWVRTKDYPQWRGTHGGEDFQIRYLASVNKRYHVEVGVDLKAGHRVKRPGLYAIKRFYERLDPESVYLTREMRFDSWKLYAALHRLPDLRDIAASNLGLAMWMVRYRIMAGWRFDRIGRLARKKRTAILEATALPAEKSWLKVLRRIPPGDVHSGTLTTLRNTALADPRVIQRLRHIPVVRADTIGLLRHHQAPFVAQSLLEEVGDGRRPPSFRHDRLYASSMLEDVIAMHRQLDVRVPIFRSVRQLRAVHDEAARRVARLPSRHNRPFGPPPLPESDTIIALRTPAELVEEALQQSNCLAGDWWADDVYKGGLYIYRMEAPERASVAIARDVNDDWYVYEFKARFNDEPSIQARAALNKWLRDSKVSLGALAS